MVWKFNGIFYFFTSAYVTIHPHEIHSYLNALCVFLYNTLILTKTKCGLSDFFINVNGRYSINSINFYENFKSFLKISYFYNSRSHWFWISKRKKKNKTYFFIDSFSTNNSCMWIHVCELFVIISVRKL